MSNYIFLIFEGEKAEPRVWNSLHRYFLKEKENTIVYGVYGTDIYSLFHKIKKDPDLELFSLLKETEEYKETLEMISKDNVSEIFLFFDYDAHATSADDQKIIDMLSLFKEETDSGKLYISYPMVEAIKHLPDDVDFSSVTISCKNKKISCGKDQISYKEHVAKTGNKKYKDISKIDHKDWKYIINEHCCKLSFLMDQGFNFPHKNYDQISIFHKQQDKHIKTKKEVSVLSSFPIFILDYYGVDRTKHLLFDDSPEG